MRREDPAGKPDKTYRLSSVFSMVKCHGYSRRLKCHCQEVVGVPRPPDPPLYETCRPVIRTTSRFYSETCKRCAQNFTRVIYYKLNNFIRIFGRIIFYNLYSCVTSEYKSERGANLIDTSH